jgi:predicted Zn-dependent protease with MMP-like domain
MKSRHASFMSAVDAAVASLPAEFREKMKEVAIVVRDRPSKKEMEEAGVPPDEGLYGLFQGAAYGERSVFDGPSLPDRIILYREALVEDFPDPAELRREIAVTIVHEAAHYFGLDEDDIRRLGYG